MKFGNHPISNGGLSHATVMLLTRQVRLVGLLLYSTTVGIECRRIIKSQDLDLRLNGIFANREFYNRTISTEC